MIALKLAKGVRRFGFFVCSGPIYLKRVYEYFDY